MKKKNILKEMLCGIGVTLLWLIIWEIVARAVDSELIFPSFVDTLRAFSEMAGDSEFYMTAVYSVFRVTVGFAAGVVLGAGLGVLCAFSEIADRIFAPLRSIVKTTPVSSFILLLLFWTDRQYVPSFISMLIVLPVVHSSVYEGIKSTDPLLTEMAEFFKVPMKKQIFTIYAESVKSRLFAASATALGLAWKAGIAAEVLATPIRAIGTEIYESKKYLETPQMFAWTVAVILLSTLMEKLALGILKLTGYQNDTLGRKL